MAERSNLWCCFGQSGSVAVQVVVFFPQQFALDLSKQKQVQWSLVTVLFHTELKHFELKICMKRREEERER